MENKSVSHNRIFYFLCYVKSFIFEFLWNSRLCIASISLWYTNMVMLYSCVLGLAVIYFFHEQNSRQCFLFNDTTGFIRYFCFAFCTVFVIYYISFTNYVTFPYKGSTFSRYKTIKKSDFDFVLGGEKSNICLYCKV